MGSYERPGADATLTERIDAAASHLVPFPCEGCIDAAKLLIQYRQDAAAWARAHKETPAKRKGAQRARTGGRGPSDAERHASERHARGFKAEPAFRARLAEEGIVIAPASDRFALFDGHHRGVLVEGKERDGDFWDAAGGLGYPTCYMGAKKWLIARANPRRPAFFTWYAPGLARVAWVRWSREVDAATTIEPKMPDAERAWQREDTAHVPAHLVSLGWPELAAAIGEAAEELRAAGVR